MEHSEIPGAVTRESSSDAAIDSRQESECTAAPVHWPDGTIDHPDGTVEFNGYFFEIDWDEIDPPEGHPDAQELPHEAAMAEICQQLGFPPGSL